MLETALFGLVNLVFIRDPASISTNCFNPRPVCTAQLITGTLLLSEVLRYVTHLYSPKQHTE